VAASYFPLHCGRGGSRYIEGRDHAATAAHGWKHPDPAVVAVLEETRRAVEEIVLARRADRNRVLVRIENGRRVIRQALELVMVFRSDERPEFLAVVAAHGAESTVVGERSPPGPGLCVPGVLGGLSPRRNTSATAPFSTNGPSGESEKTAGLPAVVHWPALPFWKSQYGPLSWVQKLTAQGWMKPVVIDTASWGGVLASASLNWLPNWAI